MPTSECVTENRPYMGGFNHLDKTIVVYRPDCKMWSCPYCASRRKAYLAIKTYHGHRFYKANAIADGHNPEWSFMTVTSHEDLTTFDATIAVWPKVWRKLKERIRRKHNKRSAEPLRYVYLPELHKDGRLHGHFVSNAKITENELKDDTRKCGGGFICEVDSIDDSEHAAWYVTKYIHKTLGVYQWPRNFRRIRFTNKWPDPPNADDFNQIDLDVEWKYLGYMHNPENYKTMMLAQGWKVDIVAASSK